MKSKLPPKKRPRPDLDPLEGLLPYQRAWVADDSRFKFGLFARQTGKDFSAACEGIRDILLHSERGLKTTWLIAAPSERQSLESLAKWRAWAEVFRLSIADTIEEREEAHNSQSRLRAASIVFPGGSRVIAVPGRPDTVRGFSANILLTEFAFFEQPELTWRAMLPSITNPLGTGPKKCRLISTPNGAGNKAHQLWTANYHPENPSSHEDPRTPWSCHRVTIHEAVAQGLPLNIEELRLALEDPEGWAQEYELQFLDQSAVLLSYDLIAACENPEATASVDPAFWARANVAAGAPRLFLGIDFGRKHDLTVCWTIEVFGGGFKMTREVLELHSLSTPEQVELLRARVHLARLACLDYTGAGVGLGDYLVREFGEWDPGRHRFGRLELCAFTNALKTEIFPKLRMECERRLLGLPVSSAIREDLHSINRVALPGGGVTYRAAHSADGHADRCTALALAVRAAASAPAGAGQSASIAWRETSERSRVLGAGRFRGEHLL